MGYFFMNDLENHHFVFLYQYPLSQHKNKSASIYELFILTDKYFQIISLKIWIIVLLIIWIWIFQFINLDDL